MFLDCLLSVARLSIRVATLSNSVPRLSISVARLSIRVATLSNSVPRLSISVATLSNSVPRPSVSVTRLFINVATLIFVFIDGLLEKLHCLLVFIDCLLV